MLSNEKNELLIIDPQWDFCNPDGALYVPGAEDDMNRLAEFIKRNINNFSDINVTLDSHHLMDVAHPCFWINSEGEHPKPFINIEVEDIETGIWMPTVAGLRDKMLEYTKALRDGSRYGLTIWPPHCLIGSKGQTVVDNILEACNKWCSSRRGLITFVTKGSHFLTEHYSAVRAEVPDPQVPSTQIDTRFIGKLQEADNIYVAGEAGSHCLANTVIDIANEFNDDSAISKIVLLEDATSPVPGCESLQEDFIKEMVQRGMRIAKTTDF